MGLKFSEVVSGEDGIVKKVKRKRTRQELQEDHIKRILNAASKGQVELPSEESYIVEQRKRRNGMDLDNKLAEQGFSLIEQVRSQRPADLLKRNLKYIKYVDKKRKLDPSKAKKIVLEHMRKKTTKDLIRKEREKITGLRDPKKEGKKKEQSVFTEADFAVVGKRKKKVKKSNIEYL
ncbi:unnamed protein product [Heligmosomoides polygyrus]|uniref:Active regulator of SIRT1 n=1 Tax=Heligmosomoides polygyrus TaxID=6339 RepID=A0A183G361_HELPZ|nr:unnamed protein product [Heligmosomoides polygyrus]